MLNASCDNYWSNKLKLLFITLLVFFLSACDNFPFDKSTKDIDDDPDDGPGYTVKPGVPISSDNVSNQLRHLYFSLVDQKEITEGSLVSVEEIKELVFDPVAPISCDGFMDNENFIETSEKLGGISWGFNVQHFRNEKLPYFYAKKPEDERIYKSYNKSGPVMAEYSTDEMDYSTDAAAGAPPPTIQRADLIGRYGDYIIFLSEIYGLFMVKVFEEEDKKPEVSCSVLIPGTPKNFYLHEDKLVMMTNAGGDAPDAAVMVFSLEGMNIKYIGSHVFSDRGILDSRLFNDTLAVLTKYYKPYKYVPYYGSPVGVDSIERGEAVDSLPVSSSSVRHNSNGEKEMKRSHLSVLKLSDDGISFLFEDTFIEQNHYGDWNQEWSEEDIGKVVSKSVNVNDFLSASDRYLLLSRQTYDREIKEIETYRGTYSVCTNRKEEERSYETCYPVWEEQVNPNYDSSINCSEEQDVETCFTQHADQLVEKIWIKKETKCETKTYTYNVCTEWGSKAYVNNYPIFTTKNYTDLIVYRFEDDNFIRLDDVSGEDPIRLKGIVKEHKSFQFQKGYLYTVSTTGNSSWWSMDDDQSETKVHSFKIAGNAFVPTGTVEDLGLGEQVRAVLFNQDQLYIVTFRQTDPLYTIDLSIAHQPTLSHSLKVPGYSTQLIALGDQLLGIGQINPYADEGWMSHSKLSLYDISDITDVTEQQTLILGEKYSSSFNGADGDDQIFHFQSSEKRLFLAYDGWPRYDEKSSGGQCRANYALKNRLSISKMQSDGIELEADLIVSESIIRSLTYQDNKAMSFGNTTIYNLEESLEGQWKSESIRELYINDGVYTDPSLGNLVVVKQIRRSGYDISKMRFTVGVKEAVMKGDELHYVDIPSELFKCFGSPRIRFLDDNLLIVFSKHSWENDGTGTYKELKKRLAYKVSEEGFAPLSEEQAMMLETEKYTICYYANPKENVNVEIDQVEGGFIDESLKMAQDRVNQELLDIESGDIKCERRDSLPYESEYFCFGDFSNRRYCQNTYSNIYY